MIDLSHAPVVKVSPYLLQGLPIKQYLEKRMQEDPDLRKWKEELELEAKLNKLEEQND